MGQADLHIPAAVITGASGWRWTRMDGTGRVANQPIQESRIGYDLISNEVMFAVQTIAQLSSTRVENSNS